MTDPYIKATLMLAGVRADLVSMLSETMGVTSPERNQLMLNRLISRMISLTDVVADGVSVVKGIDVDTLVAEG